MKRIWLWLILGLVLAGGIGSMTWLIYRPQAAIGDTIYDPFFCDYVGLYGGKDYGSTGTGRDAQCFLESNINLASADFDNKASSVHVAPGYKVTLYDGVNFTGDSIELTADTPNLNITTPNFDNRATSIKVEKIVTPKVSLTHKGDHEANISVGQYSILEWTIEDVALSKCSAQPNDGWWTNATFGENTSATGSVRVTPTATTTYKLTCGNVSNQVVVNVSPLPDTKTPAPAETTTSAEAALQGPTPVPDSTQPTEPVSSAETPTNNPLKTGLIITLITLGVLGLVFGIRSLLKNKKANG